MFETNTLVVSDIATKKIKDSEGELSLAVKATVKNLSDDPDVHITIQGIDEDGFELLSVSIYGEIPIGQSKILTTREGDIDAYLLKQVVEWRRQ